MFAISLTGNPEGPFCSGFHYVGMGKMQVAWGFSSVVLYVKQEDAESALRDIKQQVPELNPVVVRMVATPLE